MPGSASGGWPKAGAARVRVTDGRLTVAIEDEPQPRLIRPTQLESVETAHAMTVHKSQGSQYGHAIVVLPEPASRILSRELLYTAVTRAQRQVTVVGSEESLRAAIGRQVQRASGLRAALWGA